jgi:hypothetical protein
MFNYLSVEQPDKNWFHSSQPALVLNLNSYYKSLIYSNLYIWVLVSFLDQKKHWVLPTLNWHCMLCMNCSEFLFPPPPAAFGTQAAMLRQLDGQYELFTHVEKTIRQNLQQLVMRDTKREPVGSACESLLAGALAMALCYIHRYYTELCTRMC